MTAVKVAKLALEDGTVYEGRSFGAEGERQGEVVFHTALSGYQEILTDPSYKGQIVTMTYPHIGNYGVNEADVESARPWVEGFVAREFSRVPSNFRATRTLEEYLERHRIVAIDDIDTRALTRKLRVKGSLNGLLSTVDLDDESLVAKARRVPSMEGLDLVKDVTRRKPGRWPFRGDAAEEAFSPADGQPAPEAKHRVAVFDCGAKWNILRLLALRGCDLVVYPADTPADVVLKEKFDGVFLSNGPGDPAAVTYMIDTVRTLLRRQVPTFGICLGHQIMGLALGGRTYKLKFGHHGANHPVKNLRTEKVEITSQNHGFAVDEKSLEGTGSEVTHLNLNDGTVEGLRHRSIPAFSVQYHPEASPGPHDSRYLFDEFIRLMDQAKPSRS